MNLNENAILGKETSDVIEQYSRSWNFRLTKYNTPASRIGLVIVFLLALNDDE